MMFGSSIMRNLAIKNYLQMCVGVTVSSGIDGD